MILVPANKVEKIKYFSTLLGLIFIEITRGPLIKLKSTLFFSTHGAYLYSIYISLLVFKNFSRSHKMAP